VALLVLEMEDDDWLRAGIRIKLVSDVKLRIASGDILGLTCRTIQGIDWETWWHTYSVRLDTKYSVNAMACEAF
jgi:hypothetical protein